jgi:hypothetical protein
MVPRRKRSLATRCAPSHTERECIDVDATGDGVLFPVLFSLGEARLAGRSQPHPPAHRQPHFLTFSSRDDNKNRATILGVQGSATPKASRSRVGSRRLRFACCRRSRQAVCHPRRARRTEAHLRYTDWRDALHTSVMCCHCRAKHDAMRAEPYAVLWAPLHVCHGRVPTVCSPRLVHVSRCSLANGGSSADIDPSDDLSGTSDDKCARVLSQGFKRSSDSRRSGDVGTEGQAWCEDGRLLEG